MKRNTKTITAGFQRGKNLFFKPKDRREVVAIQEKLLAIGCFWNSYGDPNEVKHVDECYATGILVENGRLYHGPTEESLKDAFFCTLSQFATAQQNKRAKKSNKGPGGF